MALARREFTVVDEHGDIVTDAQVEVRSEIAGQPLVSLYSDRDGNTPLGNPFSVDAVTAVAAFHVAGGAYRIRAYSGSFERIERYVGIGTASESDAGLIPTSISTGWDFDDATADADPGSGLFRLNNAAPGSATAIYIDNENAGGNSVTAWLDSLDDTGDSGNRGQITICDPDQPTEIFRIYQVSGSVVDGTGYRKLTVAHITGAGSFTAGAQYSFSFSARGTDSADDKVAKSGDTMTGPLVISIGTATSAADYFQLTPTDFGSNKPKFVIAKAADAQTWNVGLWDGSDANGSVNFISQPTYNSNNLLSTATGIAQGSHTIWVPAGAMITAVTSGAATGSVESSSNDQNYKVFDFDDAADEHVHFQIAMPASWDEGTITFQVWWSSTAIDTDGVAWGLQGVAVSDNEAIDASWGTPVVVTDDAQSAAGEIYVTSVSAAVTIGGSPAAGDIVFFRLFRDVSDANDDMTEDARLIGIKIFYNVNAATD
jgi:hypothetical protein